MATKQMIEDEVQREFDATVAYNMSYCGEPLVTDRQWKEIMGRLKRHLNLFADLTSPDGAIAANACYRLHSGQR